MTYQREFTRWLRVGVVGVGSHAYRNILPALHHLPVRLVALCDRDACLLEKTAVEYGVSALYTDAGRMYAEANLDAVFLCAGPEHHPALAMQAFAAGLHVWMEKPPAMRAAGVEAMMAAHGDRVCAVGFKKTAMPAARKAEELLAQPEFGRLRSLLAVYPVTIPRDGAKVLESGAFSQWLSVGCHPLSLMLSLGGPVTTVTTLRDASNAAEAVGVVYLDFANGASGVFHLAGGAPGGYAGERYELFGEGQAITIENSERVAWHRGIPFDYHRQRDFTAPGIDSGSVIWEVTHGQSTLENMAFFIQGIYDELYDFCDAVLEGRPPTVGTLEFALQVMQVYEATLHSDGRPVLIA